VQISPLFRAAAPYVKPGDREAKSTFVLGGEIDPSKSRWSATPRKIELVLHKAVPGVKWATWGTEKIGSVAAGDSNGTAAASDEQPTTAETAPITSGPASVPTSKQSTTAPPPTTTTAPATAPAYPTSSRTGPKNWDKVVSGADGAEEDDADKQDVNFFFKQLYKGATPEQQRAMMKSFVESNGTALSTDWEDVKNRKVETVPPEGVEAKKWEN
jgi:suppressor of G2 allele of SKP1